MRADDVEETEEDSRTKEEEVADKTDEGAEDDGEYEDGEDNSRSRRGRGDRSRRSRRDDDDYDDDYRGGRSRNASRGRRDNRRRRDDRRGGRRDDRRGGDQAGCKVFVSNLPWEISWQDLKDVVRDLDVGDVLFADVFVDDEGRSKGSGIVKFADPESAQLAIEELQDYVRWKIDFSSRIPGGRRRSTWRTAG